MGKRATIVYDKLFVDGRPYGPTARNEPPPVHTRDRHSNRQYNASDNNNGNVSKLNITQLNVCGIRSKLLNPDFDSLINMYDILLFTETKTDKFDVLKLPND